MADAVDDKFIQRARLCRNCRGAVARMGDELGDHRIIIDRDFAALEHAGVVAHRDAIRIALCGRAVAHKTPGGRQEVARRIFRIDAAFHRPAMQLHVRLLDRQRLAGGDADHLLDEIDAGDQLRHGMLDLQPRVHLQKEEALVLAHDEFHRAGAVVIDRFCQRHGLLAHLAAGRLVEQRRRRLLDDLLVAALDRAFALAQINHVAMLVAEHLDFDVARIDDEFFYKHAVVAKGRGGFRCRARKTFRDVLARMSDAHALAAAARRRLDHDRVADLVGDLDRMVGGFNHAEIARHGRDFRGIGEFLGFDLVAHRGNGARIGADEDDAIVLQRMGESLALGQEAIARMHGFRAGLLAGGDDLVDHEIGLVGGGRADVHGLVGHVDMERILVGVGIDGDGLDAHPARRLDDAAGDLATIGDEDFLEHARPGKARTPARPEL